MKSKITLLTLVGAVSVLTGCVGVQSPVGMGSIYTSVKAPVAATSNEACSKTGTASCVNVLGVVATGDASITAACKNAGITKIHHVDHQSFSVLGVYSKYSTIVKGE